MPILKVQKEPLKNGGSLFFYVMEYQKYGNLIQKTIAFER